jgi:hypothetical protein
VRRAIITVVLASAALAASPARAGYWSYESEAVEERALARVRFSTHAELWAANFNRPMRACSAFDGFIVPCNASSSDEIGVGSGIEAAFRMVAPLYVTTGFDFVYTTPSRNGVKNQVVIAAPFSLLLTFYEWSVRPILRGTITPIVYLTDDARDYTLGGDAGFGWRVLDSCDLSITLGYKTASTVRSWQIEIGFHLVP